MTLNKHFLAFAVILIASFGCDGGSGDTSSVAGAGGMAGTGGEAGSGGIAGSGGEAGSGGMAGTGGGAGVGGMAGTGGEAGVGGMAGTGGEAGVGGMAGAGGEAGVGGMAGTGGEAGVGGMAGSGGEAGVGGVAGSGGEAGVGGMAGAGGEAGVGGMAGSGGEAGVGGMAGSGGEAGLEPFPEHSGELIELGTIDYTSLLSTSNQHTRFSAMLAQLTGEQLTSLASSGPVTVFAPSDDAFEQLDAPTLASIDALSGESLLRFVSRHIVVGLWQELAGGERLPNLNAQFLEVDEDEAGLLLVAGFGISATAELGRSIDGYVYGLAGVIVSDSDNLSPSTCAMPLAVENAVVAYGRVDGQNGSFMRFEAAEQGIYCIDTKGSAFDTTLDVFESCDQPSSLLAHEEDVVVERDGQNYVPPGFDRARLEIELQAEQAVDIRVLGISEGGAFTAGDFSLSVTSGACPAVTVYDVIHRGGKASFFLDALWYAAPETFERLRNYRSL